ncbi:MAG: hypothetical protein ABR569_10085 [Gaiellaceae bacterium]
MRGVEVMPTAVIAPAADARIDLSVVIPYRDGEASIERALLDARHGLETAAVQGEAVVGGRVPVYRWAAIALQAAFAPSALSTLGLSVHATLRCRTETRDG